MDVHCHTFTPDSFVDVLEEISGLGLIDFYVEELNPTQPSAHEFYVRLERLDPDLSFRERAAAQRTGISAARQAILHGPQPAPPAGAGGPIEVKAGTHTDALCESLQAIGTTMPLVSDFEARMLAAKRQIMVVVNTTRRWFASRR